MYCHYSAKPFPSSSPPTSEQQIQLIYTGRSKTIIGISSVDKVYVQNSKINNKSQDFLLTCCWGGADAGGAADPGLLAASPPPAAAAGAPLPRATPRPLARPVILNGGWGA